MKILCFGEIMIRLTPPNMLRLVQTTSFDVQYAGSEANVAVSLAQFGVPSAYVTRVPHTELGRTALGAISRYGVDTTPSVFGGDRLGLYYLEMGMGRRGSKVVYDRAGSGMATVKRGMIDWKKALKGVTWLHWSGITAALSQSAADVTLDALKAASKMGITISCDLNYRANLWKYGKTPAQIMPELVEYCDVLMGDGDAFNLFFDIKADNTVTPSRDEAESIKGYLKKVSERFPKLKYTTMTAREGFSASHNTYKGFLYDGVNIYASKVYDIPDILDRIGGGDAFMAGLIYGMVKNNDPQHIVEFATAAATLKHYVVGDYNLATVSEVESLVQGNMGGRVSR
jgi:2-dehydro-3-deoxygluconokinase